MAGTRVVSDVELKPFLIKVKLMKKTFASFGLAFLLMTGLTFQSCKNKNKDTTNSENTVSTTPETTTNTNTAPVTVSGDDELRRGVTDATKDFPGVQATVNNGEVTLTGSIKRDRVPTLMQSLNSLQPRKINNNLTIQ
jgi:hypothetical protein